MTTVIRIDTRLRYPIIPAQPGILTLKLNGGNMLTQKRLREVLSYDASTGVFIWKAHPHRRVNNTVAGSMTRGYIQIRVDRVRYFAHRLAWLYVHGSFPGQFLDHINLKKDDNRISNLREVNKSQNGMNTLAKIGASRFKGVDFNKRQKSYRAKIRNDGKSVFLGHYKREVEAAFRYDMASIAMHGEYGRRNFLPLVNQCNR